MKIEREEAFTAGILHDIGKIVLDGLFAEFYVPAGDCQRETSFTF